MQNSRIETLSKLLENRPNDPRAHFGLALEYERLNDWQRVVDHLTIYLSSMDDEGNAYGRLARALRNLGREEDARSAYADGIKAAGTHGHPTLVMDLEAELDDM